MAADIDVLIVGAGHAGLNLAMGDRLRTDDSWIDVPQTARSIVIGPHRRGPVPGLWIVRAPLLGPLFWQALDAANDLATR